jgi:hypothetical protein
MTEKLKNNFFVELDVKEVLKCISDADYLSFSKLTIDGIFIIYSKNLKIMILLINLEESETLINFKFLMKQ